VSLHEERTRKAPSPGEWGVDQPLIRQLLGAIRTADRARRVNCR
jgi:hypothetical protein